jgi:hypothetical protein
MADPWAEFRVAPAAEKPKDDPWAEFRATAPSASDIAYDVAASGAAGVGKGVAQGLGGLGDLKNLASAGTDYVTNKAGIDPETLDTLKSIGGRVANVVAPGLASVVRNAPTSETVQKGIEKVTGEFHKPTTDYGRAAEAVGEFIPGAVTAAASGGGTLAGNLTRFAAIPGVTSAMAEKYLPESEWKPYQKAGLTMASTLINPARIVTPIEAAPAKRAAVDVLEREGVTSLTAGQRTGNKALQYLESAASHAPGAGHGAAKVEAEGQRQFTEAALRRAGATGEATPEVLAANQERLGRGYREISSRNVVDIDTQALNDINAARLNYERVVPQSQQSPGVSGYIADIAHHIRTTGYIPGDAYQALRSNITSDISGTSDGYLKNALTGIRNALDNAMVRSVSPEDAAAWRQLNREYSGQKVIEKAASRAGEATAEGQITPANLRNTVAAEDRSGYARGRGQFNELARAGVSVMTPLPNSGTAQRANAFHLLNAGLFGVPQALAGRAVMSPPVQGYLANQLMNGALPDSPAARRALMVELLLQNQKQITDANNQ